MNENEIRALLAQMNIHDDILSVTQFLSEEDSEPYNVWKIQLPNKEMVLKEAKGCELETYRAFFAVPRAYAPRLYSSCTANGKDYLLMEHISGPSMTKCTHDSLRNAIDSLAAMQSAHWNSPETAGFSYEKALSARKNRGNYLNDPLLEAAYSRFLREFSVVPRTLCHDDLLPFNVILEGERAVFIDWEVGGILPYPTSLARLIAHGEESEDAFFYLTEADRAFAIDDYYEKLVSRQGISYPTYRHTLDLFLFYEYCEWVFVGNKYDAKDTERYQTYLQKAQKMAEKILK